MKWMTERRVRLVCLLVTVCLLASGAGCSKQARKQRALARAEQDYAAEKYDRAEIEYAAVLRVPPPEPRAVLQLGRIYFAQGRYPQAWAYLQKSVELQPDSAEALARYARACVSLGKLKDAREQALVALDREAGNVEALRALVEATVDTNQVEETQARLQAVPPGDQAQAGYHLAQGLLHLRSREFFNAASSFKAALGADERCAEAHIGLGTISLAQSNFVAAEAAFKTAAEVAGPRSAAPLRYADLKLRTGASAEARKVVEAVAAQTPDYIPAWVFLAQMAAAEQQTDACAKLLETILARDPMNLDALMLKGNLFLSRSDATNALNTFESILRLYGKIPVVQYRLALAQLQNRETAKARSTLSEVLSAEPSYADAVLLNSSLQIRAGDASSAVGALTRLSKEQPGNFQAHAYLAEAYLALRKSAEAIAVYEQMRTLFPGRPEVPVLLGSVYLQQSKRQQARECFEKALEIAPDYLLAEEKLIDLDLGDKNFSAAAERARRRIEAKPKAAEPWLFSAKVHLARALQEAGITNIAMLEEELKARLAQSREAQSEMAQAEADLAKAIELKPDNTAPYLMLAQLYVRTDRHQQALERLDILASTNSPRALLQIGLIQKELKNYGAARDAYERMIKLNPNDSAALNNLAYLYTEQLGDLGKALEMAQKARDLLPQDPRVADTLGWVFYRRGDYERAVSLLQEAGARMVFEPEVQFHLGLAHYMSCEEGPARLALERALQSGKDFTGKDEAKKRLNVLNLDVSAAGPAEIAQLQKQAKQHPEDVMVLLRLAEWHERAGRFAEARDLYETVLRKNPRNGRLQFMLAWIYTEHLAQPAKAMELAKSAHELLPDDAEISGLLGRLAMQQKEHQWALSLLLEAARKLPDNPELLYDLALAYYSVGNVREAEATLQRACSGTTLFAREQQAKTFLKLLGLAAEPARAGEGLSEARALLEKQPDYVPALVLLARANERDGDFKGAAATYEKVFAVYPLFTPAMKNLAMLYALRLGDDQKAYELAMKARASLPKDAELARTLGILSYRRSEFDRSVSYLDQSVREQADDAEAQFYKGMAHYKLNQKTMGEQALKTALSLKLDAKLEQEARKALEELGKGS